MGIDDFLKFAWREVGYGLDFVGVSVKGVEFEGLNDDVLELPETVTQTLHRRVQQGVVRAIVRGTQDDDSVAVLLKDLMIFLDIFKELGIFAVAVLEGAIALVSKVGGFDVPVFGFVFEGGLLDVGGEVGGELSG